MQFRGNIFRTSAHRKLLPGRRELLEAIEGRVKGEVHGYNGNNWKHT